MNTITTVIIIVLIVIGLCIFPGVPIASHITNIRSKNETLEKIWDEDIIHATDSDIKSIQYSEDMLKYLTNVITTISMIMFHDWYDRSYSDKINISRLKALTNDAAIRVKNSINDKNIKYDVLLYTDGFIDWFIINGTITAIKKLFRDNMIEIINE